MEILQENTKTIAYFISSEKYLSTATAYKNHRQSTVEVLKMLSMLHTYKKYSLADNNLEVLYAAYGQKEKDLPHRNKSLSHLYKFIKRADFLFCTSLEQYLDCNIKIECSLIVRCTIEEQI